MIEELIDTNGSCKMIDYLTSSEKNYVRGLDTFNLVNFYVNYYNTVMKIEKNKNVAVDGNENSLNLLEQITELEKRKNELVNSLNQVTELEKLKKELLCLLNQKKEVDTKILLLIEKINTLEGGKSNNARK